MSSPLTLAVGSEPEKSPQEYWDDKRLLAGLQRGDPQAARALYDSLRPAIDRTLCRLLHQRGPDYEDLVQSSFERILRNLVEGRFEGRSSLRTWAAAIASHVALDSLRQKQRYRMRHHDNVDQDALPARLTTESRIESLSELARVQAILAQMNPDLVETLILHDVLGYQLNEISSMADASLSATQSRLLRGRKELKRRAAALIPSATRQQGAIS